MVLCKISAEKPITIFFLMLTSIFTTMDTKPLSSSSECLRDSYWWHEPCSNSHKVKHPGRHTRDIPHNVRTQINITYHTMLKIYNKLNQKLNINGTFPNLKHKKSKLKLTNMYNDLQNYAAILHNIKNIGISSNIHTCSNEVYFMPLNAMENTLKTLMCEISTAVRKKEKIKCLHPDLVNKNLEKNADCSIVSMYRSTLIKSFTEFLQNLNKKYNRRLRRNKSKSSRNKSIS